MQEDFATLFILLAYAPLVLQCPHPLDIEVRAPFSHFIQRALKIIFLNFIKNKLTGWVRVESRLRDESTSVAFNGMDIMISIEGFNNRGGYGVTEIFNPSPALEISLPARIASATV